MGLCRFEHIPSAASSATEYALNKAKCRAIFVLCLGSGWSCVLLRQQQHSPSIQLYDDQTFKQCPSVRMRM